ncbi:MAG TPA: glycerophosphodiester phosphodiesterase [Acidimicrobiales bacterium]|nr:glycerophosphodiester phosphodiesterase [Acidimicrobiales bacterium]
MLCYAHQGGAREGPSSTLWAMERAVAGGADAIELDVHATADGHIVVCHDPTVDATTNGSGRINAMTLAELRELDNAYWWVPGSVVAPGRPDADYPLRGRAPGDPSLRIATLDEVLEAFPGVFINLDIKSRQPPYEEALARCLRAHGRGDDVIVASFNDASTDAFRAVAPEFATSAGTLGTALFWRAAHTGEALPDTPYAALQVPVQTGDITVCDEVLVEAAHRAGLAVHVWTIDDPDEMARLIGMGVDGIITDVPSVAVAAIDAAGARWGR